MKITAIMGSPRLGDSYRITQIVEERLKKHGEVDFEYVFLKDCNIEMCRGCFSCVRIGERHCPIHDDVQPILEKIRQADGLIFASPVYALSVTGLMKNFKDRTAWNAHRPSFFGKKAMAVVTSEGTGIGGALGLIKTWDIWGIEFTSELGVNIHPTLKPTKQYEDELNKKVDRATEAFYKGLQDRKPAKPKLMKVVQFNVLKHMATISRDGFPADYEYYKDKKDYYYEMRVSFMQRLLSKFYIMMVSGYMRKNYIIAD